MIRYILFILLLSFIISVILIALSWYFNINVLSKVIKFLKFKKKKDTKIIEALDK